MQLLTLLLPRDAAASVARGGPASTSDSVAGVARARPAPPAGGERAKRATAAWRLAAAATGMPSGTRETLTGEVMVITFQSEVRPAFATQRRLCAARLPRGGQP